MSTNKLKYWAVRTTTTVKANTKAEAIAIATRQKGYTTLEGKVLQSEVDAERVNASVANSAVA
jgi:hypothetical protein